ncbi:MAG: integrase [Marmoricola sp.]|nr:integrase [Marmoricola sp.]
MASINDRWHVSDRKSGQKVRSSRYGRGKRWQVRYRDPSGESRNRSFDRKVDADRFMVEVSNRLIRGDYVDRRAGRIAFADYAAPWLERQVLAPTSRASMETRMRVHVYPHWGTTHLVGITPAGIQRWIRELQESLAPSYVRLIVTNFSAVLSAAVLDGLLSDNPCRSRAVRVPAVPNRRIRPWTVGQLIEVLEAMPARYRALVAVGAGCGLRQGECFGLRVHDVDFLRDELHVRQQIRIVAGMPTPALPKYARTRTVPMPEWVKHELAVMFSQVVQPGDGCSFPDC